MSLLADSRNGFTRLQTFGPSPREHASSWVFEGRGTAGKGGAISRIVDPLERPEACEFEARSEYLVFALDRTFDPERLGLLEGGVGRCWGQDGRIEPHLKLEKTSKLQIRTVAELPHRA